MVESRDQLARQITISGFDKKNEDFSTKLLLNQEVDDESSGKIFLKDFDIEENEHFVKYVFIPYFKDIFKDLSERSDKKAKGINKMGFLEYVNLPGILNERFFKIMDENSDEYIDQKEFMRAMFKVYYSQLESKFKLVFDMYDFDLDGIISQEDCRLVLSHIPLSNLEKSGQVIGEGQFTMEGGGQENFEDRKLSQYQIKLYLDEIFKNHGKPTLNLEEFTKINQGVTSEMFLSIMILLHDRLPCSDNFFKYFKNYDKYMEEKNKGLRKDSGQKSPQGDNQEASDFLKLTSNSPRSQIRSIQKPKYGLGLSPIHTFLQTHSPGSLSPGILSPLLKGGRGFNVDTQAQKGMLQNAALNIKTLGSDTLNVHEQPMSAVLRDSSPRTVVKNIPLQQFKQSIATTKLGKLTLNSQEDTKESDANSPTSFQEALRLPNISLKQGNIGLSPCHNKKEGFASPSGFLSKQGDGSQDFSHIAFDSLKSTKDQKTTVSFEGELYRRAANAGKLKKYWFSLLGKEMYCYKEKDDEKHKDMHSLIGVFVKSEKEEQLDANKTIYPFKIIFPQNKVRQYYCKNRDERSKWLQCLKQTIGYSSVEEFYDIQEKLGKGKFGEVKLAIHNKTKKKVAIKVIKKKNMSLKELELQKREIEVLKICQHPNIIRLLDVFENPEYIYIVLEHCAGGDLFQYLDKRDFKITEDLARHIAHQIAAAIYYIHSYGITHRDLKLENILMMDNTDSTQVKLVDFGLSKMIGPNETSTDPFGTLSYVAPEVLMQRPYGKNVDLWSLGIIIYVLMSGMLPFDSDDNKETARQTIYDPVPFEHAVWKFASPDVKDLITRLLEKDRFKRISLENVLQHPWICQQNKEVQALRQTTEDYDKFEVFTQTQPKSPKTMI